MGLAATKPKRRKYHIEVGDPYAEGADAATAGRDLTSNPYPRNTDDYLAWNDGWHTVKSTLQPLM